MEPKIIGRKLRELRGNRKIIDVARDLGISKSAIAMYEAGARVPKDSVKVKLAKYFDVSVESIFFTE